MHTRAVTAFLTTAAMVAVSLGAVAATGPEPEPGAAGVTGGPVTHVGTLPVDAGSALGSTVHEDLYIVTGPRSLSIYDTSNLVEGLPTLVSTTPLPGVAFNEEPRTDGERLILQADAPALLYLFDISDPALPQLVNVVDTSGDLPLLSNRAHLWACVYEDCSVIYSSHGMMLDITDMENPVELGMWTDLEEVAVEGNKHHAIDEVAPGLVWTGSEPMYLLDARADAANPTVIATGRMDERGMIQGQLDTSAIKDLPFGEEFQNEPRYYAARVEWPARTTPLPSGAVDSTALLPQHERWGIVSVETPFASDCDEGSGPLLTYDMDRVEEDGTFTVVDDYRITHSGQYVDGYAPAHTVGCFAYAFSQHPDYTETRLVAVSWTEHGMRLVTIDEATGHIDEVGFFVGYAGTANDAEWITDELVAIATTERGVDIVRVDLDDV